MKVAPGQRLPSQTRARISADAAKLYNKGMPIRAIAEHYGRSYGFVHRILSENPDVKLRARGGVSPRPIDGARINRLRNRATKKHYVADVHPCVPDCGRHCIYRGYHVTLRRQRRVAIDNVTVPAAEQFLQGHA